MSVVKSSVLALAMLAAAPVFAAGTINIDTAKPGAVINQNVYGQVAEHLGTNAGFLSQQNTLRDAFVAARHFTMPPTYHACKMYLPFQDATSWPVALSVPARLRTGPALQGRAPYPFS